ncbi:ADP-ribose pyrophosphatase [Bacillus sp. J14TS2]|uniref:NUDIX domain-containing protein n=1 Tax=Bacillus sp. J14TS2 TaxID=2807188 RepID=UPI001B24A966|nr:NUDIX domain-containing protein [Bacillus sp. J14TS2]GIN72804.1 ADP-ribose pyrophosphatase [Bacillus sp. J14TS2]
MAIRTAARAIIIHGNCLLVLKRMGVQGEFYVLPGGGQEHGESIFDTLKREVGEEVSLEVEVEQLLFLNEFIAERDSLFPEKDKGIHQIDFTFLCKITSDNEAKVGDTPDAHQIGIQWVPLSEITDYDKHPKDDVNFIMGAPTRDTLARWISNGESYKTPTFVEHY